MLLVHLEKNSPRARYIVRHVCERMLGWPVSFAASLEEFRSAQGSKLSYGSTPIDGAFHVKDSDPLDRNDASALDHFASPDRFDVFAAAFFLLSLADEYTIEDRDLHGRIPATSLTIVKKGMERMPVVDQWALELADGLRERFPALPLPTRTYRHTLTVDVDNGLKYIGRPVHRAMGASVKDLLRVDLPALRDRWRVRSGGARDPYFGSADALASASLNVDRAIAFFLVKSDGRFDHAASMDHPAYRELVQTVSRCATVGLHPSYESRERNELIAQERDRLASTTGRVPTLSRQHFLRWELPRTFRALIASGFTEDHSIGFTDRAGFRAGTCTPFPWYDLEREEEMSLLLHPFACMDSALCEKMNMSATQATMEMKRMSDAVREVNGTFVSVWHDRYLSGYREFKSWPQAMLELVQHARA